MRTFATIKLAAVAIILFICVFAQLPVKAQNPSERSTVTTIRATAEGISTSATDRTQLVLQIQTLDDSAEDAAEKNLKEYNQAVAIIRRKLGRDTDIQTIRYRYISRAGDTNNPK